MHARYAEYRSPVTELATSPRCPEPDCGWPMYVERVWNRWHCFRVHVPRGQPVSAELRRALAEQEEAARQVLEFTLEDQPEGPLQFVAPNRARQIILDLRKRTDWQDGATPKSLIRIRAYERWVDASQAAMRVAHRSG